MSEIDVAAAGVFRPLSSTALSSTALTTRVVADAFQLAIRKEDDFHESKVAIEQLEFASFAVGGLAAAARQPTGGQVRASSTVTLPLTDSAGGSRSVQQVVTLFGPGDVRGIDPAQIVRRYPAPGATTAEEVVLAHVEFDRPELPWQFSAAEASGKLRPWVTLIVVEKAQVQWEAAGARLPVLRVPLSELPNLDEAHLWSHAQVPRNEAVPLQVRLSPAWAPVNLSRLLSPRILRQDTDYLAAIVPTTEVGARAGLGLTGGGLGHAWPAGGENPVRLPVYDSWSFRTGPDGDFRSLALKLKGVVAPYAVGRRFIDTSSPGLPLGALAAGSPGARQVLRCALVSPSPPPAGLADLETATWPAAMVADLHTELDRPAAIESGGSSSGGVPNLPIIGPRLYGGFHRDSAVVAGDPGSDWFAQLNLGPIQRIVAGLGTRVVQRDQEPLMQAAWAQIGEVEKANRAIQLAQLAELVAERLHRRLDGLQPGRLLQLAAPLAPRLTLTTGRTLQAEVAGSATPTTTLGGAFRRAIRPGGPMLRRAAITSRLRAGSLVGSEAGLRDFTRVYANPDGVGRLGKMSLDLLDVERAGQALKVQSAQVRPTLDLASRAARGGLATLLTDPGRWRAPVADVTLTGQLAAQWSEILLRVPTNPAIAKVRELRTAPLVAELAISPLTAQSADRAALETRAVKLNNDLLTRLGASRAAGGTDGLDPAAEDVIRRRSAELRSGHAVGGAIARRGGSNVLLPRAGPGRIATRIPGLLAIDPTRLTRIPGRVTASAKVQALRQLSALADRPLSPVLEQATALSVEVLRQDLVTLVDPGGLLAIDKVPRRRPPVIETLATSLAPALTVRAALAGRLQLSGDLATRWKRFDWPRPIMAAPRFDRPMYQALNDYDPDWLLPGLGLLPDQDFVTVLATNSEFMEAFLVGLSDEMGRELLWRNYPTDRRGTCFWRFWDAEEDELRQPIHAFSRTPLASHVSVGGNGGSAARAVIVVKSELVRRFPDLVIQVTRNLAPPGSARPVFESNDARQETARQLFSACLEPDTALVCVDLSIDEIDQEPWWVLIAEHPAATRFDRPADGVVRDDRFLRAALARGASSGAAFAKEQLHRPTRIAFKATDLVVRS